MILLYALEPYVGGLWGANTVVSNEKDVSAGKAIVPEVSFLDYAFEHWDGDDLVEAMGAFAVTERLSRLISSSGLTGYSLRDMQTSSADDFEVFLKDRPEMIFPSFLQLVPEGSALLTINGSVVDWSGHDFCWGIYSDFATKPDREAAYDPPFSGPYCLVVSARCLDVLQELDIGGCQIQELLVNTR